MSTAQLQLTQTIFLKLRLDNSSVPFLHGEFNPLQYLKKKKNYHIYIKSNFTIER